MKLTTLVVAFLLTLLPIETKGEQPRAHGDEKPAWEWTQEERIAARLSPRGQEARRQRAIARGEALSEGTSILEGSLQPELFLPAELFDMFVSQVFVEHPGARASWRGDIGGKYSGRLPDDFWERLDHATRDLQVALERERRLARKIATAPVPERQRLLVRHDLLRVEKCTLFQEALTRARALLPPGEFDRLLYEGVAPNLVTTEPASSEALLLKIERGC